MRDLERSLQPFGEFLLKGQLVRQNAAFYFVRWVRRFRSREATNEPLSNQVRRFCDDLERTGDAADWHRRPATSIVDEYGGTSPLEALEEMRRRIRTRHEAYRTECTYVDWAPVRPSWRHPAWRDMAPIGVSPYGPLSCVPARSSSATAISRGSLPRTSN